MEIIEIVFAIIIFISLILGVMGIIIEKIRTGNDWNGQRYGK